jgi:hypothetical protein
VSDCGVRYDPLPYYAIRIILIICARRRPRIEFARQSQSKMKRM